MSTNLAEMLHAEVAVPASGWILPGDVAAGGFEPFESSWSSRAPETPPGLRPETIVLEQRPPFLDLRDRLFRDEGHHPAYLDRHRAKAASDASSSYWRSDGSNGALAAGIALGRQGSHFYESPLWDEETGEYRAEVVVDLPMIFKDLPPYRHERLFTVEALVEIPKPAIKLDCAEGKVEVLGEIGIATSGSMGPVWNPRSFAKGMAQRGRYWGYELTPASWITGANVLAPHDDLVVALLRLRLAVATEKAPSGGPACHAGGLAAIDLTGPASRVLPQDEVEGRGIVLVKKMILTIFSPPR
jgi:hypothetical protein